MRTTTSGDVADKEKKKKALRTLVVESAHERFKKLFGQTYSEPWGQRVRDHIDHLTRQEAEARSAARDIRKNPAKARAFLKKRRTLQRQPFTRPETPVVRALCAAVRSGEVAMRQFYLLDDPLVQEKLFTSERLAVMDLFETLPMTPQMKGSFGTLGAIKHGRTESRISTDAELTAIFIVLYPELVAIRAEDVSLPPEQVQSAVWKRERKRISVLRTRHGSTRYFGTAARPGGATPVLLPVFWPTEQE